jgi:Domain of unknown function (DUF4333)
MLRTTAVAVAVPLLAAPLLATGPANAAGTVKIPKLERKIKNGFKGQAQIRVTVKCPNKVTWVKGKVFYCKATSTAGTNYRVRVRLGSEASAYLVWKVVS